MSANSSTSSPPASLSPSSVGGSGSSTAFAPPPPPPLPTTTVKQRKKPGPKPKPKALPSVVIKLKVSPERLAALNLPSTTVSSARNVDDANKGSSPTRTSPQPSTASPGNGETPLLPPQKRRGVPGPKPGSKRGRQPGALLGKPGRKKTKLDPNAPGGALLNGISHGAHGKPGPKANTGAINDKLRALDRSGKPCKRWTKTGFTLKSFTGVEWSVSTWATPVSQQLTDASPAENTGSASAEPSIAAETPPDIKVFPEPFASKSSIPGRTLSHEIVA